MDLAGQQEGLVGQLLRDGQPACPGLDERLGSQQMDAVHGVLRTGRLHRELQHAARLGEVAGQQVRAPEGAESERLEERPLGQAEDVGRRDIGVDAQQAQRLLRRGHRDRDLGTELHARRDIRLGDENHAGVHPVARHECAENVLALFRLAAHAEHDPVQRVCRRSGDTRGLGHPGDPLRHRGGLAPLEHLAATLHDQIQRAIPRPGVQQALDRRCDVSAPHEPVGRVGDDAHLLLGVPGPEPVAEQVAEEVMEPEPLAVPVDRDEEHRVALEFVEEAHRVRDVQDVLHQGG